MTLALMYCLILGKIAKNSFLKVLFCMIFRSSAVVSAAPIPFLL